MPPRPLNNAAAAGARRALRDWTPDARDALAFVGLVLLGAGFWAVWQPLALIVPGAVLIYAAVIR